jgi:membrane protease YdiL (CAAX protease family)
VIIHETRARVAAGTHRCADRLSTGGCLTMAPQHLAILLVIAPLIEETAFRAGLQEWLLRHGRSPVAANVATALAFGAAHVAMRGAALAFATVLPALLVGLAYDRWRRVRWCAGLHAAMNAAWVAAVVIGGLA